MTDKTTCIEEILNCCITAFVCPRGRFYPNKNFGSHIKEQLCDIRTDELLAYARQSVSELDGVYIKEAELAENEILFTILINDEKRQVSIAL